MVHHRSSGLRGWEIALGLLAAVVISAGSWSLWTGQRSDATSISTRPLTATTAANIAAVTPIASATTAPASPTSVPSASAPVATATTAPATATTPLSPTTAARGATATPDMAGAGHVSELDPAVEARRQVVGQVGDGALGDRVATLVQEFYAAVPRAYRERKPEVLKPMLTDDFYVGAVQGVTRAHSRPELSIPITVFRLQPTVLTNLRPNTYALAVAEIRYDRDIDPATGKGIRVSRPYRQCARWYLVEVNGVLKLEGRTVIPERHCDAGWPDPVTPTKEA